MRLFRLNPITRKRLNRFRAIKRGYYSLVVLVTVTLLSFCAEYISNSRAIAVSYKGEIHFPTWKFLPMSTFDQESEYGQSDVETDYRLLKKMFEWAELTPEQREAEYEKEGIDEWFRESLEEQIAKQGKGNWVLMPPVPYGPIENDFKYESPPPNAPDSRHILGTDSQGRDVFSRLLYGYRVSITFSLALVFLGLAIGTIIGSLQGYLAGWFDILSQRGIEIWSTLPFLYVVIIMGTFFRPSFTMLLFILLLFEWMGITYYMRTEMYREKTREYCLAARSIGSSNWRVIFKHLLPNCLTPLVTLAPFLVVGGIFALTSLDYLGYGLPAPTPSWGELIEQSLQPSNRGKLWLILSPFCALVVTLTLVTLVGESVREAFDPKQYARYE